MRRTVAARDSAVFFIVAPLTVAGVIPGWLARWQLSQSFSEWLVIRSAGILLIVVGGAVLLHAFARFVTEGLGTPAPVAPAEQLVVGGPYRYVRNPMYLAVIVTIVGQGLLFLQAGLFVYASAVTIAQAAFVHWHEEPDLMERFGDQYVAYRDSVAGWLPRIRRRR
jgi:protein-S-isoprenylcysteine O-methyltransferase Ste14